MHTRGIPSVIRENAKPTKPCALWWLHKKALSYILVEKITENNVNNNANANKIPESNRANNNTNASQYITIYF